VVYVGYKVPLGAQERDARFKMKKRQGFTLVEIVIVVVVIGLLSTVALTYYKSVVEKAKINSAMSTMVEIGKAESLRQMTGGDFVAANSAEEISKSLAIDVDPKYYEYRVVGVTDDEFMVLAAKIDTGEIVLAMNQNGVFQRSVGTGGGGGGGWSNGAATGGSEAGIEADLLAKRMQFKDSRILSKSKMKVMDSDAAVIELSYLTLENLLKANSKLVTVKEKIIILSKGNKFYFLRYENSAKEFNKYKSAFMRIAQSMKIK